MTTRQFLAYGSAKSTAAKFARHRLLYAANEGLNEEVGTFNALLERVGDLAQEQAAVAMGLTTENSKAREDLILSLVEIAGIGEGWAAAKGQEILRAKLTTSRSDLSALGLRIELHAAPILKAATEAFNLGASRYGMTQEMLDDLSRQIQTVAKMSTVRDSRDARKTVTTELGKAIVEMMAFLLNVIDPLMNGYQRREPRFFEEYRNSRRIGGKATEKDEETKAEDSAQAETAKPSTAPKAQAASTDEQMTAEGLVIDQDDEADAALAQVTGENEDTPTARETSPAAVAALSS